MTRAIVRGLAVSFIILVGAVALRAQAPISDSSARTLSPAQQQDARIIALLIELADEARSRDDAPFAARAQMQAATLLWPRDREQARSIYRRAFYSLAPDTALELNDSGSLSLEENSRDTRRLTLSVIERQQLRGEMLNRIAGRDPELAEELARALADSIGGLDCRRDLLSEDCESSATPSPSITAPSQRDVDKRELLISVALQIVERSPQRAMALGQLSLPAGISTNFARLLLLMRSADAALGDLLFASALARLEQSQAAELSHIHTLGSYLVSAINSPAKESVDRKLVTRFLNLAFNHISRRAERAAIEINQAAVNPTARRDDTAALYFIGRQLTELFARYQPARLGDLRRKIIQPGGMPSTAQVIDTKAAAADDSVDGAGIAPGSDDERDRINARAALTGISNGEISDAQTAAMKIVDVAMRDRVLVQVVRLQVSKKCFEDAVALARCINDDAKRVDSLVMLAGVALSSKDAARAADLLNEAEGYISKARPTAARAGSLLKVVSAFSGFDSLRSFEVMQTAVRVMNEAVKRQDDSKAADSRASDSRPADSAGQLYGSRLEATLETLGRVDFDRALYLAQQIADEEAALIAQLAVCRGGLAKKPTAERLTIEGEAPAGANPE